MVADGWISKNSKPATRACNRPAFTRLASAWWRQADLSVSTNTQLAFCTSARLARLAGSQESADMLAQPCFSLYIVCRPFSRVRASNDSSTMRRIIVPTSVSPTSFSTSAQGPSITSCTHRFVHPRIIFAPATPTDSRNSSLQLFFSLFSNDRCKYSWRVTPSSLHHYRAVIFLLFFHLLHWN